ncbi:hypothetical protein DQ237_00815 [Blastococcus sp. TF02-8]|uniref:hypothetical protein n=1 Tax=Blastococcus sp. TF02-8 TaxID=2250574 RepID=UPI000DE8F29C|nr:hypothetical protein [Blastococcus sp. TF02-8]RBY97529.1 hypothetical protein DQ237_00815 [Blastococcus sp. TF02-8]
MAVHTTGKEMERYYSGRQQAITVAAGTWVVLGVFVDGWAHLNRPGLETFFTPWHAILYSGAAALFGWLILRTREARSPDRPWVIAAAAAFAVGGAGDLLWHEFFGVETGVDALVSPTHLLLMMGGLIGLTAPLRESRDQRLEGFKAALPVLASLALAAALSAFFLLYASPYTSDAPSMALTKIPEGAPGHEAAELPAVAGLAGYLITTAVVVIPLLILRIRGLLPFGGVTVLVTVVATLSSAVNQFEQPLAPVAALVAGLIADLVVVAGRSLAQPVQLTLLGAVVPLLLWVAQLASLGLTTGVEWPPELVVGVVVLSTVFGSLLALLAAMSPRTTGRVTPA